MGFVGVGIGRGQRLGLCPAGIDTSHISLDGGFDLPFRRRGVARNKPNSDSRIVFIPPW